MQQPTTIHQSIITLFSALKALTYQPHTFFNNHWELTTRNPTSTIIIQHDPHTNELRFAVHKPQNHH